MKLRRTTSIIRIAICTFLITAVRTEPLPPSSVAEHRHDVQEPRDDVFLSQRRLSSRSSSSDGDDFRIRRSDFRNRSEEADVATGARYFINASPTSHPIMFLHDANSDSHEVRNSMLLIKKRRKKPPHFTVFNYGSIVSEEDPLISSSQLPDATTSALSQHNTVKMKTSSSPPPMYYENFNIGLSDEKYYSSEKANVQNANFGISGNVWRRTTKIPSIINNHHLGSYVKPKPTLSPPKTTDITKHESQSSAVVWRLTTKIPSSEVFSNHRPGSKGRLPGKKPPYSGSYSIKLPHSGVNKPAYFSFTTSSTASHQSVRKPVYISEALSTIIPYQAVKKPSYFSLTSPTTAPHQGVIKSVHTSEILSTTTPHQAVNKKPSYFSLASSTTASHQGVRKAVYVSETLSTTTPHQSVKGPAYFSLTSTMAPRQGVKQPVHISEALSTTTPHQSVKKPVYGSQISSTTAALQSVKKPAHFAQASATKVQYTRITTVAPLQHSKSPETLHFTKSSIPSSFTITTQRTHSERFTTDPVINKGPTQRPSSIKGTSSHVLPTSPHGVKTKPLFQEDEPPKVGQGYETQVNNHKPLTMITRRKPLLTTKTHNPSSQVAVVDKPQQTPTDIIGHSMKLPETVRSKWLTVLDAPSDRPTTIKHNKVIVAQKRIDKFPQETFSPSSHSQDTTVVVVTSQPIVALTTEPTTAAQQTTKVPETETYPVAPVMDPWADIPMPSVPGWAVSSTTRPPSFGSPSGSSFFPGMPFIPYLGSLISPLLTRPLTPSAVNTGMQGIKAMQGFLRNSLMGAMFCFLPSALIAITMSATQRAELRKIPEINNFMLFCKKCLENLENAQAMNFNKTEPDWVHSIRR